MLVWSSMTVNAAVPRPRQPVLRMSSKSSFVSSSSADITPMLMPPGTTALACRPFQTPPACSSINSRAVTPRGSSTHTWRLTCPETVYSFGP